MLINKIDLASVLVITMMASSGMAWANQGIDSAVGVDLPISAGGITAMTVHAADGTVTFSKGLQPNVGIGTETPIRQLHISSGTAADPADPSAEMVLEYAKAAANYKNWNLVADDDPNNTTKSEFYIRQLNDAGTSGSVPFLINGNGNVGIGTTSPKATLDVNGGIHTGSATTGASCSGTAEGTFAYDAAAHLPVYCSNYLVWTQISQSAPITIVGGGGGSGGHTWNFLCPTGYLVAAMQGRSGEYVDQIGATCSDSAGDTVAAGQFGGGGGGPWSFACPNGSAVAGMSGRSGEYVDQVDPFCKDGSGNVTQTDGPYGGGGGSAWPNALVCPKGYAVIGMSGRSGEYVDQISSIICGQL